MKPSLDRCYPGDTTCLYQLRHALVASGTGHYDWLMKGLECLRSSSLKKVASFAQITKDSPPPPKKGKKKKKGRRERQGRGKKECCVSQIKAVRYLPGCFTRLSLSIQKGKVCVCFITVHLIYKNYFASQKP